MHDGVLSCSYVIYKPPQLKRRWKSAEPKLVEMLRDACDLRGQVGVFEIDDVHSVTIFEAVQEGKQVLLCSAHGERRNDVQDSGF